jgi:hypothetical protein
MTDVEKRQIMKATDSTQYIKKATRVVLELLDSIHSISLRLPPSGINALTIESGLMHAELLLSLENLDSLLMSAPTAVSEQLLQMREDLVLPHITRRRALVKEMGGRARPTSTSGNFMTSILSKERHDLNDLRDRLNDLVGEGVNCKTRQKEPILKIALKEMHVRLQISSGKIVSGSLSEGAFAAYCALAYVTRQGNTIRRSRLKTGIKIHEKEFRSNTSLSDLRANLLRTEDPFRVKLASTIARSGLNWFLSIPKDEIEIVPSLYSG